MLYEYDIVFGRARRRHRFERKASVFAARSFNQILGAWHANRPCFRARATGTIYEHD